MSANELKDVFPEIRDEENNKKVAEHLRMIRKARGFTLDLLSQQTGLSVSYISRLEAGTRRMNLDILTNVSRALQCEISDIIYGNLEHIVSFQELGRHYGAKVGGHEVSCEAVPALYASRKKKKKEMGLDAFAYMAYDAKAHKDLPLYGVRIASPGQKAEEGVFDFQKPRENISRAIDIVGVEGAFAIVVPDNSFMPRYSAGDILMIHPSKILTYKSPVVVVMDDDKIISGFFQDWVDGGVSIFVFKSGEFVSQKLLKENMKSVYRIVASIYA